MEQTGVSRKETRGQTAQIARIPRFQLECVKDMDGTAQIKVLPYSLLANSKSGRAVKALEETGLRLTNDMQRELLIQYLRLVNPPARHYCGKRGCLV